MWGTAWAHSVDEATNKYDVVIEEAGQVSSEYSNNFKVYKSIILLEISNWLSQPTKAIHEYGGGLSVLEYWMRKESSP